MSNKNLEHIGIEVIKKRKQKPLLAKSKQGLANTIQIIFTSSTQFS